MIEKQQIRVIHALLAKLGLAEVKAHLVGQFTDGRTTTTKEMTWKEGQDMIAGLSNMGINKTMGDRKRKLILHYAHQMGWEDAQGKVDMERVNGWCVKYGRYHKPLNAHSVTELSHLIAQMEKAYKDYLRSV